MTSKQLKQIAVALVVLLLLWGASEILLNRSDRTRGERIVPAVDQARTDSVVIARQADTVRLARRNGIWTVNGQLASPDEVEGFFRQLGDTTPPEIAAQSSAVHGRMGVDSSKGRMVQVYQGGQAAVRLIVGERGPDYQSSYVRRPGEEVVYLRYGPFAGFVDRAVDDWREKRMANVPPDSVAQVDVTRHRVRYSLKRDNSGWVFGNGQRADSNSVLSFLQKLHPLNATGFATPNEIRGISFARPDLRLVMRNHRGEVITNLVGDSMPNGYWVRHDSGGPVFRNGVWIADEMTPHDSTLKKRG